ncbi:hypothetical protein CTAYLR_001069 [Chrysophaeum taylorii]|uniref:PHD-type domain-containing protein n=1 Tax=Chrysophaeum taylorii TaxID=2483200 RepID=A0AAD7UHW2_9STRA|nr:hypothetical protein CTAYLR_001069 [Chrysophaeum taylorii]
MSSIRVGLRLSSKSTAAAAAGKGPQGAGRSRRKSKARREAGTSERGLGLPEEVVVRILSRYVDSRSVSNWRACGRAFRRSVGSSAPELHHGPLVARCWAIASHHEFESPWGHDHNYRCERCGRGGELILCDFCNVVYHLACLSPPLEAAPAGLWRCPACAAERSSPVIGAVVAAARGDVVACTGGYHASSFTPCADAYECDWRRGTWTRKELRRPPPTGFATATAFSDASSRVHVFARRASPGPLATTRERTIASAAAFEVVHLLENDDDAWRSEPIAGDAPVPRADAAACAFGDRVVLFGGFEPETKRHLDGLYVLDTASWLWHCVRRDSQPVVVVVVRDEEEEEEALPRAEEEAEEEAPAEENRAALSVVFNLRRRVAPAKRYEDVPAPSPRRRKRKKSVAAPRDDESWPLARAGHTLTRVGRSLWLFGGLGRRGATTDYHDDVWTLDRDLAWTRETCAGAVPRGRAGHSALAVGPHLLVFGGLNAQRFLNDFFVLHTPTRGWSTLRVENGPSARMRAAMVLVTDRAADDEPHVLVFGGTRAWGAAAATPTATSRHDGDLFAVHLGWSQMEPTGLAENFGCESTARRCSASRLTSHRFPLLVRTRGLSLAAGAGAVAMSSRAATRLSPRKGFCFARAFDAARFCSSSSRPRSAARRVPLATFRNTSLVCDRLLIDLLALVSRRLRANRSCLVAFPMRREGGRTLVLEG